MKKRERQTHIIEVLERNRIDSQEQFVDLLAAEGIMTAQSTLSRDLRELGVVKGPGGYEAPRRDRSGPAALRQMVRTYANRLDSVDSGGSIVVLRTKDAAVADELARRVEELSLLRVVAAVSVAGTVLVLTRSAVDARELVRQWKSASRLR